MSAIYFGCCLSLILGIRSSLLRDEDDDGDDDDDVQVNVRIKLSSLKEYYH